MKLHIRILSLLLLIGATFTLNAQEKKVIKGFSGGMMINAGYMFGSDNPYNLDISSPTFGMGGCAKLHFSDHFRAGFEGYFSSAPLRNGVESGSHNKVFWTGLLADFFCKRGKFVPYAGLTVGGGMETAFYMFEGDKHDWLPEPMAVLHSQVGSENHFLSIHEMHINQPYTPSTVLSGGCSKMPGIACRPVGSRS